MFEVDPQPRIDFLCEDGATREPRARVQVSGRDAFRVGGGAFRVPDPESRPMALVQLQVTGRTSVPVGLSYRVELLGPPQMVLPPGR